MKQLPLFLCLLIYSSIANAQLTLSPISTAAQLASILAGPGIQISNATITSPLNYYNSFTATGTNIGIGSGILLSTGNGSIAIGPNNQTDAATIDNNPGDIDLGTIAGVPTFDAAVLEFDFIPQNDTVQFRYVFASEEYPEYVCSLFNDLFGFFITGPGIVGSQNIALIPGTNIPVAINSVNNGTQGFYADPAAICNLSYPQFYIDNTGGTTIQYDGFTTVLTAMAIVIPCETYHLKIVITDANDADFDSGVFLEAGSLSSTPIVFAGNGGLFCSGGNKQIGMAPVNGWNYSWSPTTNLSNPNIANPVVSLINATGSNITTNYVVTGSNGTCVLTDTIAVSVTATPSATFNLPSSICLGDTISVSYTGNGANYTNCVWNFGSSTVLSGNGRGPYSITFLNDGSYPISLSTNVAGCPGNSEFDTILVNETPVSNFLFQNSLCQGDSINATFNGSANINSTYLWSVTNGIPSTSNSNNQFQSLIATPGKYGISLLVNTNGCTDLHIDSVTIKPQPIASVQSTSNSCQYDTTTFIFNGTSATNAIYQWWSNGVLMNSTSSNNLILPLNFVGEDSILLVVNQLGCIDSSWAHYNVIEQPNIGFTIPDSICYGDSILLRVTNNYPANSLVNWTIVGSTTTQIAGDTLQLKPFSVGQQNIYLSVNHLGCIDHAVDSILINEIPDANFTIQSCCLSTASSIVNLSNINSGNISNYTWNFGDLQTSNLPNPLSHIYANPGTYTITLETRSDKGCKDTLSKLVSIYELPNADFTADTICEGQPTHLQSLSTINNDTIQNYSYHFSQQNIVNDSIGNYTFPSAGQHTLVHIVESNHGCIDSLTKSIYVYANPIANFSGAPLSGCAPLEVNFNDLSTSIDGAITNYIWHLGDTSTSQFQNPKHVYDISGLYSVQLEVTSEKGCVDDTVITDYINVYPNPIAQFIHHPNPSSELYPIVEFNNLSIDATSYIWNLGDGNTSNDYELIHTYTHPDTFIVQLIATTNMGCEDTAYGEVIVQPAYTLYVPNAFTPNNDIKNEGFRCYGIGINKFKMEIFNRWGNHICTIKDINESWDGQDDKSKAQEDTYIYIIELTDIINEKHTLTGRVSIIK